MSRIVIGLLLLIPAVAGCQQADTYFYRPDKTIEQAKVDCENCHEALLRLSNSGSSIPDSDQVKDLDLAGDKCMQQAGYTILPKDQLPQGSSTLWIHRNLFNHGVAGK
jgi:hypothetical protein